MKIINPEALLKGFEDFECGKSEVVYVNGKDFEIPQQTTLPLKGFEAPKDFPNCCPGHKQILNIGLEKLAKFPNCCNAHKKLNTAPWFKKSNYTYLPQKIVNTIAYTWHCISLNIDKDNWYKPIADYIDLTAQSFGQLPLGYGPPVGIELYLHNLEKNIENEKEIPIEKKEALIAFVKNWGMPGPELEPIDFNLLIKAYKTWIKDFPFEMSLFSHLKPHFENQMPLLEGKGETNIYTGITAFKVKTYQQLIEFLVKATEKIISEVNTLVLYEKGLISDIQKANIDVINGSHRFNLKSIQESQTTGRKEYIKVIKNWFKFEKEYLNDLSTALSKPLPIQKKDKKRNNIESPIIALFCYVLNDSQILAKGDSETILSYCKRVCSKFKLPFKDRVRQCFSTSRNNSNIQKIKAEILPNIDEGTRGLILQYLENKPPKQQNLYA